MSLVQLFWIAITTSRIANAKQKRITTRKCVFKFIMMTLTRKVTDRYFWSKQKSIEVFDKICQCRKTFLLKFWNAIFGMKMTWMSKVNTSMWCRMYELSKDNIFLQVFYKDHCLAEFDESNLYPNGNSNLCPTRSHLTNLHFASF